ncbi:phosphate-starvation-inducible protein PsiE, partial [Pseudomonas sp. PA-6-1H]|nr:phosphate-starvation-inducible protein PsiE [Pseudomonas sp. PA-6-1H]
MSEILGIEKQRKSLHGGADSLGSLVVEAFHYLSLFGIALITIRAAISAFIGMLGQEKISVDDILL